MVARMLVRMISLPCNLIKCYCYVVDRPSWALVMMMMILNMKNHFIFVEI
jgi:hypothetical protein